MQHAGLKLKLVHVIWAPKPASLVSGLRRAMAAVLDQSASPSSNGLHHKTFEHASDGPRDLKHSESVAARFDHALAAVKEQEGRQSQVYVIGGLGVPAESPLLSVHTLDPDKRSWVPVATMGVPTQVIGEGPVSRGCHATAVVGSSIYMIGGYSDGKTLDEVIELDTLTKEWKRVEATGEGPGAVSGATATAVGDKIYVFGGAGSDRSPRNTVHILDTQEHRWLTPRILGDPPPARCAHTATLVGVAPSREELDSDAVLPSGDRILIYGGYGSKPFGDAWFLEVATPYVKKQASQEGGAVLAWSRAAEANMSSQAPERRPVVICGPSGVGKGTLINKLMAEYPEQLGFSVSHTTRKPRPGEKDGVHYHFTEKAEFEREITAGKFLEYAHVHGNIYGTSVAAVEAVGTAGRTCILDIDVQGAQLVKNSPLKALFLFILPPSEEELENRLRGRKSETEEEVQKRLRAAKAEIERATDTSLFDHTLVNDDLEQCYSRLKQLLGLGAEAAHAGGLPGPRSGHSATLIGESVLVYGGIADGPAPLSDVHLFETATLSGGAPETTTGLRATHLTASDYRFDRPFAPEARFNHRAVGLSLSEVLLVGGYDGMNALGDTAILKLSRHGR